MRRYLVCWVFAAAFLALTAAASGQTPNLQLILEGPFVVCEDSDTRGLDIAVPNLQGTHHAPVISSKVGDLSYNAGDQGDRYHDATDDLESVMTLRWNPPETKHAMNLNPPHGQVASRYFYVEKGKCDRLARDLESVLLKVPMPDEVLAYRPTEDPIYIADHDDNTILEGPCKEQEGCPYATEIVLHYLNVDFSSIDVETTCRGKGPCITHPGRDSWRPGVDAATGSELALELKTEPIQGPDARGEREHARMAFSAASRLAGVDRDLKYGRKPSGIAVTNVALKRMSPIPAFAPLHRVCQVPPVVLCTNGGACPAN